MEFTSMAFSRRQWLGMGPAILAASATRLRGAALERMPPLSREMFLPLVNSPFELTAGERRVWLTLISVVELNRTNQPGLESFALRFYAPGTGLAQDTYTLRHDAAGSIPLFLVPSGDTGYVAVISHLTGSSARQ